MSQECRVQAVWEDSTLYLMARITGPAAANIAQADLSTISLKTYDSTDGSEDDHGNLTISAVVFNTLQTDARWTVDDTGYNFRHTVTPAMIPDGGREYTFEYKLTFTGGEIAHVPFIVPVKNLLRS